MEEQEDYCVNSINEEESEDIFLEDGESIMIGTLLTTAELLGVKVFVVGHHVLIDEDAPEEKKELITKLSQAFNLERKKKDYE